MALALCSSLPFSTSTSSPPSLSPRLRTSPTGSSLITIPSPQRMRARSLRARPSLRPKATVAVDSPAAGPDAPRSGPPRVLLEVKDLRAVIAESGQEILRGVNLTIYEGEVHAIMGKNGSGKSTFAKVLVGHPDYETPVEIPGVSNFDFLNMAYNARRKRQGLPGLPPLEFYSYVSPKAAAVNMDLRFLDRNVNEGFSGGEKKRNEILQLAVLEADLAILDEIDSGLDVDALQDVAKAVNGLLTPYNSVLMITHYLRLLDCINPSHVHIMEEGSIVKTGDVSLAKQLEKEGYKAFSVL
ncbi:ABC transporter I family member 6, chloroplastic-like [Phoenix dactylifera]|uniref:ABC transporter I family member 6, chloroplastic-like n=1 Tax=Phoenix dactylifera TaxID=42345 RepID=A0A8B7D150_PHODC|nr:ABC transporter I family member 6, chloroplastic-like [Phoenix dactylifera]